MNPRHKPPKYIGGGRRFSPDEEYDVDGAAERLGIAPITVRRLIKREALRHRRYGKLIRITEAACLEFIAQCERPSIPHFPWGEFERQSS